MAYNRIRLTLFKLTFYPYYYVISQGNIIDNDYIKYGETVISQHFLYNELTITYECDNKYNCFNRVIGNDRGHIFRNNDVNYTNYVFINFTLTINGEDIVLYFRTNNYNFYICDNVINADFLFYFITNIMKWNKKYKIGTPYVITILDHCFKEHKMTHMDYLVLGKNNFKIIKNDTK